METKSINKKTKNVLRKIRLSLTIALLLSLFILALQNTHPVTMVLGLWEVEASLTFIVLISSFIGILSAVLLKFRI